jgi:hypothetical protein
MIVFRACINSVPCIGLDVVLNLKTPFHYGDVQIFGIDK